MHKWISRICLAFLMLSALLVSWAFTSSTADLVTVAKVYDGDTLLVKDRNHSFKVRLAGIDAPETGYQERPGQPYSRKAKQYLSRLVLYRQVGLKTHGRGGYDRLLAEVFYEEKNINLAMVRAGLAEVYRGRRPQALDSDQYLGAERRAKSEKAGMWQLGDAYVSPRQWRKKYPLK